MPTILTEITAPPTPLLGGFISAKDFQAVTPSNTETRGAKVVAMQKIHALLLEPSDTNSDDFQCYLTAFFVPKKEWNSYCSIIRETSIKTTDTIEWLEMLAARLAPKGLSKETEDESGKHKKAATVHEYVGALTAEKQKILNTLLACYVGEYLERAVSLPMLAKENAQIHLRYFLEKHSYSKNAYIVLKALSQQCVLNKDKQPSTHQLPTKNIGKIALLESSQKSAALPSSINEYTSSSSESLSPSSEESINTQAKLVDSPTSSTNSDISIIGSQKSADFPSSINEHNSSSSETLSPSCEENINTQAKLVDSPTSSTSSDISIIGSQKNADFPSSVSKHNTGIINFDQVEFSFRDLKLLTHTLFEPCSISIITFPNKHFSSEEIIECFNRLQKMHCHTKDQVHLPYLEVILENKSRWRLKSDNSSHFQVSLAHVNIDAVIKLQDAISKQRQRFQVLHTTLQILLLLSDRELISNLFHVHERVCSKTLLNLLNDKTFRENINKVENNWRIFIGMQTLASCLQFILVQKKPTEVITVLELTYNQDFWGETIANQKCLPRDKLLNITNRAIKRRISKLILAIKSNTTFTDETLKKIISETDTDIPPAKLLEPISPCNCPTTKTYNLDSKNVLNTTLTEINTLINDADFTLPEDCSIEHALSTELEFNPNSNRVIIPSTTTLQLKLVHINKENKKHLLTFEENLMQLKEKAYYFKLNEFLQITKDQNSTICQEQYMYLVNAVIGTKIHTRIRTFTKLGMPQHQLNSSIQHIQCIRELNERRVPDTIQYLKNLALTEKKWIALPALPQEATDNLSKPLSLEVITDATFSINDAGAIARNCPNTNPVDLDSWVGYNQLVAGFVQTQENNSCSEGKHLPYLDIVLTKQINGTWKWQQTKSSASTSQLRLAHVDVQRLYEIHELFTLSAKSNTPLKLLQIFTLLNNNSQPANASAAYSTNDKIALINYLNDPICTNNINQILHTWKLILGIQTLSNALQSMLTIKTSKKGMEKLYTTFNHALFSTPLHIEHEKIDSTLQQKSHYLSPESEQEVSKEDEKWIDLYHSLNNISIQALRLATTSLIIEIAQNNKVTLEKLNSLLEKSKKVDLSNCKLKNAITTCSYIIGQEYTLYAKSTPAQKALDSINRLLHSAEDCPITKANPSITHEICVIATFNEETNTIKLPSNIPFTLVHVHEEDKPNLKLLESSLNHTANENYYTKLHSILPKEHSDGTKIDLSEQFKRLKQTTLAISALDRIKKEAITKNKLCSKIPIYLATVIKSSNDRRLPESIKYLKSQQTSTDELPRRIDHNDAAMELDSPLIKANNDTIRDSSALQQATISPKVQKRTIKATQTPEETKKLKLA